MKMYLNPKIVVSSNRQLVTRSFASICFPSSKDEFKEMLSRPLELPQNPRLNQVAILGATNAGKSSLVNALIGFNISGESSKIHTTRENIKGIFIHRNVQVELTDTPGCITSKHAISQKLEPTFLKDPDYSCNYANIIAILVDASITRFEPTIARPLLKLLYKHRDKKSILVLTKVDQVRDYIKRQMIRDRLTGQDTREHNKRLFGVRPGLEREDMQELFRRTEELDRNANHNQQEIIEPIKDQQTHWPHFSRVFFTSTTDGMGIQELREYLVKTSYPNPWLHNSQLVTETHPTKVLSNIIKSRILDNVQGPAAYNVRIQITDWFLNEEDNTMNVIAKGRADSNFFIRRIIGLKGQLVARINNQVMDELARLFKCQVNFRLNLEYVSKEEREHKEEMKKRRSTFRKETKDKDLI